MSNMHKTPFYINTAMGRVLVLKYIKVCEIPEVQCAATKAMCVLKTEEPMSPKCERAPASCPLSPSRQPQPPACPLSPSRQQPVCPLSPTRQTVVPRNNNVPFMNTNLLENLFSSNKNAVSKILG
ncbi:DNA-binding phosphoprotein [Pteropox virus]|uniref:DNA-binding phosphoprotein n=1 Tax=Pteropox virus TaxID=1873698 RepID=A0A1B1MRB5_9POXV|nr:DNA-binding phosphoprotein [Pteropox virus]ANS71112.1 DNA-binding phosphoprotein [Pteropox virus]